ncbi:protein PTST homolog 3, chloroplastic isoform X2 [Andrographis paniculata]|uniref:protein PTST homolog 3, chloroplastic isoform X2 n=1 Tax=Andrographis paniculata TaxID=175694 RepID=UPI0021E94F83|nr:protein PTST homolog 3, chloroplastic isoform X2 [Andrographis paniculata]
MAVLCHFPYFTSLTSSFHKLPLSPPQPSHFHFNRCCWRTSAVSSKKPRNAKKNGDLFNEIRRFLSSVGLPENHVPSMKELSEHGRQDLANRVRRRGYKYIRKMLDESMATSSSDNGGKLQESDDSKGQDENLEVLPDIQAGSDNGAVTTNAQFVLNKESSHVIEPAALSLHEKAANFIERGELEAIEDCNLEVGHAEGSEQNSESETLSENAPPSLPKNENPAFEEQAYNDKDLDFEARELETQAEVKRLKFLLNKKETELALLKQQIEKEKLSLSVLQTEAETEMSLTKKLISEKENQLEAAEESLSGLKEVEILYSGDGEFVELAGSFNGWRHTLRMELETLPESRTSRLWRTVLWLYPGIYEIKFIVDGQWKIDPQRESTTRGSLQNNVLRVER